MSISAYLDTAPYGVGGAESTTYGLLGSTGTFYNLPDPSDTFFGDVSTANGNTGIGWLYEKEDSAGLVHLRLIDFGDGGDSSDGPLTPRDWIIITSINLSAEASDWHRLSIDYDSATGNAVAKFDDQTFNFTTETGLVGAFYVGYRESLAGVPALLLRPPTFDISVAARACCVDGVCVGDMIEQDCLDLGGNFDPNATCGANPSLPLAICNIGCSYDNRPPLDDFGAPASQYAPDYPFSAAAADDFILNDIGANPCQITHITTWTTHFNGNGTPADYTGINVTVYANATPKGPGGQPEEDGSHSEYFPGGIVHSFTTNLFTFTQLTPTCIDDMWQIDIDVDFELEKNVKYWLEIQPIMNFDVTGQVATVISQNSQGHNAQQGFPVAGIPYWQEISGNAGACPPDTPPGGTRRDLAFLLIGENRPECEPPIAARSCNLHGTFECCLDIGLGCEGADPGDNVEPRFCGVNELCVDFAGPVNAASLAVAVACTDGEGGPVPYAGAITLSQDDPDTVCIDFNPKLPNDEPTCCELTFTGSGCGQWSVASLPGDVSRDRAVTVSDKNLLKSKIGDELDANNCHFDVSCDGAITVTDKALIKPRIGDAIPCCR
ncbi:MAG: hypothetical protein ACYS7M_08995 [Planctomycetota bacterium]